MTSAFSDTNTWILQAEIDADVTRVRVVGGPDAPANHVLASDRVVVGTSEGVDIRLSDATVSRHHCELSREEAGIRVRDLDSKNGSWLAGQRVYDVLLGPGAQIRVGQSVLEMGVDRVRIHGHRWVGGSFFGDLVGYSASMQRLFGPAARAAENDEPVLVYGESGAGKELLARAIHARSGRAAGAFVVLDCAALGTALAEVELFGHARGAFTGAIGEREGVFERAHGGTILLDAVDQLPLEVQPLLLRVLERSEVRRVGESVYRKIDFRAIATASDGLERLANRGLVREDLLHRLNVIELRMPPLRERREDVVHLAHQMLAETARAGDVGVRDALARELALRESYRWPGNARELRTFVRRIAWLGDPGGEMLSLERAATIDVHLPYHDAKQRWMSVFEREYLARLLEESGGNVAEAARRSGLNRTYLHELLKKKDG
jgi:two-component system, NtrC family, response regulator GlrR